jgi:hypothetical protein
MRCAALALLLISLGATADVVSPAPDSVRVTLYGNSGTRRKRTTSLLPPAGS